MRINPINLTRDFLIYRRVAHLKSPVGSDEPSKIEQVVLTTIVNQLPRTTRYEITFYENRINIIA